ncbi:ELL-associated factor [Marchantia polymorpha subsp. ruderalis]|uniref:Transcription elongation factor Eaf N-terminal domain-containing protein n=2 Tax=Marchantia polymorpha TaxID=3197 RepID=A0AAF6ANM0_MARPO|nr:hypothetical protein MARPO_0014s0191 [Marchantia polymorpha]BBM98040.1 hypothetical protein Mp_1g10350 [Marchantia polymorpha subsp. ruderalis]|eukprot:PTQ45686.1 hypothetical protein MARPO_0014s0191 [Marchantia polymorpha]
MVKAKEPVAEQWYPMKLGSSCQDDATTRFYSLRYEFKPASIDSTRPGTLHNSTENKCTVEFFNNQAGKPKVGFQGNSEDCKELDAVLFFDGKSFRLERMHRAFKSLRHIRQPGESSAAAQGMNLKDSEPDEDENGNVERISTSQVADKSLKKPPMIPVQREKIESEEITPIPSKPDPPAAGKKKANKKVAEPKAKSKKAVSPAAVPASPVDKKREREPSPVNIDIDDEQDHESPTKKATPEEDQIEVEEVVEELSEYEEVDISEDEEDKTGVDQTAATLRAQAAAGDEKAKPSSSSSSSGSGSSGSGSGSSSSDSGSDEEDSASSADDGDDI